MLYVLTMARAPATIKTSAYSLGFVYPSPSAHVFNIARQAMAKTYNSRL